MKFVSFLAAAAFAFAAFITPAAAFEGPTGIAVVASPEAGSGACFEGEDPAKGFACAKQKCARASGDQADQCMPVAWCFPSLFAMDMVVNNSEGFTYHQYFCGMQDRDELVALARAKCALASAAGANACAIASAWDPDGKELTIEEDLSAPR